MSQTSKPIDPFQWGRVVHWVRHGQYEHQEGVLGGQLTRLGQKQAHATGRFLARWPVAHVHCSDFGRARETAALLLQHLDPTFLKTERPRAHRFLREVVPTRVPYLKVPLKDRKAGEESVLRAERAFLSGVRGVRHDVVVCHGNLIRYLVARNLGAPRTTWMRLGTHHCGITTFVVVKGRAILQSYNGVCHLAPGMLSCR